MASCSKRDVVVIITGRAGSGASAEAFHSGVIPGSSRSPKSSSCSNSANHASRNQARALASSSACSAAILRMRES
jgi:hypothetical protein